MGEYNCLILGMSTAGTNSGNLPNHSALSFCHRHLLNTDHNVLVPFHVRKLFINIAVLLVACGRFKPGLCVRSMDEHVGRQRLQGGETQD